MEIFRSGTRLSTKGASEQFTGDVRIEPLLQTRPPARAQGATVQFAPGARTAWHSHPLGQTLIVLSGQGRVQAWEGPVEEMCPGDVIWAPPGEKHWHGATPETTLVQIAVQEALDGRAAQWMELVSDEQYLPSTSSPSGVPVHRESPSTVIDSGGG